MRPMDVFPQICERIKDVLPDLSTVLYSARITVFTVFCKSGKQYVEIIYQKLEEESQYLLDVYHVAAQTTVLIYSTKYPIHYLDSESLEHIIQTNVGCIVARLDSFRLNNTLWIKEGF